MKMRMLAFLVLARLVVAGPESSPQYEQSKSRSIRDDLILMIPGCKLPSKTSHDLQRFVFYLSFIT
jgi:hypothetical protein